MTILPKTEYFSFLKPTCHVELTQRYSLWKSQEPEDRSSTIPATLKEYDEVLRSNVSTILLIWTVFPVRTLRLLKTYLRSTMDQCRLTSLALMHIRRDIPVNTQKIVANFVRRQPIILLDILME